MSDQNTVADIAPLSREKHGDWSLEPQGGYNFARRFSVVPVVLRELSSATHDLPIFFAPEGDGIKMIALLSARKGFNAHVREDGAWEGGYIPAVLRQYPFVIGMLRDQNKALLSIDQGYPGFNQDGRGAPLFDESGELSEVASGALKFVEEFSKSSKQTQKFCEDLNDLDILNPVGLTMTAPDGTKTDVRGLLMVSREKLIELPAEKVRSILRSGMLEVIFMHLHSLRNLNELGGQSENNKTLEKAAEATSVRPDQLG